MRVSIKNFAKHRQVSFNAIFNAIAEGRLTKGEDGLIDLEEGDKELEANSSIASGEVLEEEEESIVNPITFSAARTKNEILKAEVNEIRVQQLNGELVEKEEAIKVFHRKAKELRDTLLGWPARVSSQIASQLETDPHTTNVVLERFIHELLTEISNTKVDVAASKKHITITQG